MAFDQNLLGSGLAISIDSKIARELKLPGECSESDRSIQVEDFMVAVVTGTDRKTVTEMGFKEHFDSFKSAVGCDY